MRATIQGEHQGSEHACGDVVDVSNMMDVTALHNAVEARVWGPYGTLDGFRSITQPTSWGHETFDDLVKYLYARDHEDLLYLKCCCHPINVIVKT